jgi:hypothetical protein
MHREKRNVCRILVRKPKERDHYEDLDINVRVVLKLIVEKEDEMVWLGIGTIEGLLQTR